MKTDGYHSWTDSVFARLQNALGGDALQAGSSRVYGVGRIGYGMNRKPNGDTGEVVFQVGRTDDLLRRYVNVGPYEWYAYPNADVIVRDILHALQKLGRS